MALLDVGGNTTEDSGEAFDFLQFGIAQVESLQFHAGFGLAFGNDSSRLDGIFTLGDYYGVFVY